MGILYTGDRNIEEAHIYASVTVCQNGAWMVFWNTVVHQAGSGALSLSKIFQITLIVIFITCPIIRRGLASIGLDLTFLPLSCSPVTRRLTNNCPLHLRENSACSSLLPTLVWFNMRQGLLNIVWGLTDNCASSWERWPNEKLTWGLPEVPLKLAKSHKWLGQAVWGWFDIVGPITWSLRIDVMRLHLCKRPTKLVDHILSWHFGFAHHSWSFSILC